MVLDFLGGKRQTYPLFLVLSAAEGYTITSTTPSVTFCISCLMSSLVTWGGERWGRRGGGEGEGVVKSAAVKWLFLSHT